MDTKDNLMLLYYFKNYNTGYVMVTLFNGCPNIEWYPITHAEYMRDLAVWEVWHMIAGLENT